jgi:WD40 repeat protein
MFPDTLFRAPAMLFVALLVAIVSVAGTCGCGSKTWPEHDGRLGKAVRAHEFGVVDIEFSADGKWVFTCGQDGIKQWDAATFKLVHEQEFDFCSWGHSNSVDSMAADVHRPLLYLGTTTQEVQIWNYETRQVVATIPTRERWSKFVPALATSPDGKLLAIAENSGLVERKSKPEDFTILIWDLEKQKVLGRLPGHPEPVDTLFFLPNSTLLFSRTFRVLSIWDAPKLSLIAESGEGIFSKYEETTDPKHNIAFAVIRDGHDREETTRSGTASQSIPEFVDSIRRLDKNTCFFDGNDDGLVQVFDAQGRVVDTFQHFGNGCSVEAVAVSPDGKLLVSGGDGAAMGGIGIRDDQRSRNLCFWRLDKKK